MNAVPTVGIGAVCPTCHRQDDWLPLGQRMVPEDGGVIPMRIFRCTTPGCGELVTVDYSTMPDSAHITAGLMQRLRDDALTPAEREQRKQNRLRW